MANILMSVPVSAMIAEAARPFYSRDGLETFVLFGKVFLAKCRQFSLAFFYLTPNEVNRLF